MPVFKKGSWILKICIFSMQEAFKSDDKKTEKELISLFIFVKHFVLIFRLRHPI